MVSPRRRAVLALTGGLGLVLAALGCSASPRETTGGASPARDATVAEARAQTGAPGYPEGISVTGVGRATMAPDLALLDLGVEAQEATVSAARERAAAAMQAVAAALRAAGVAERDIQTRQFSIQPVYHWEEVVAKDTGSRSSRQVLDGYRVSNRVVAKVRDLAKVGAAIDGAVAAGGDLVRVDSIAITVEDPSRAQAEARARAMQDAVARAQQLAQAAGVSLGRLLSVAESAGQVPPPTPFLERAAFAAVAEAPTPIQAGELEVAVTIQARFALQ